jgi:putative hydroxymethylpyrimidine transport system substrate-binding protein
MSRVLFSPAQRALAAAAMAGLVAIGLPAQAADKAMTKVRYQQAFAPSASDLPLYVAAAKGFFAAEGLEVEIRGSQDATNAVSLVGAGDAQLGVSYPPDILLAAEKGLPIAAFYATYQVNPLGIVSLTDGSNIRTPKDLVGKKIGLTPLPIDQLLFDAMIQKAGVTRKQMEIFNPGFNGGQMVGEHKLDGASGVPWYEIDGLKSHGMNPVLMQYRDFGGVDFPFMVLIANKSFAEAHPDAVKGFVKAMTRGDEYVSAHPEESIDILLKAVPALDRKRQAAAMKTVAPLRQSAATSTHGAGWIDMAQIQGLADFLADRKLLAKHMDASTVFTNKYR